MNNHLQFLVELLGEDQAEEILQKHVKQSWTGPVIGVGRPRKIRSDAGVSMKTPKVRVPFSDGDRILMERRARQLYPQSNNWATVAKIIAGETGRKSVSSVYNYLYRIGLVKEFSNGTS